MDSADASAPWSDAGAGQAGEQLAAARPRLESVDVLRGLAIALMSLDHVREFFSAAQVDPTDLSETTPALFLTRWVTHFCAPVFVFLVGAGAFLFKHRGNSSMVVARFLVARGLLLVALELTLVRMGWFFTFDYSYSVAQVIWVIGWSMVILAGLNYLPLSAVGAIGVLMIAWHNLFDAVTAETWGRFGWLWTVLHEGGTIEPIPGMVIRITYMLIPWAGVMAAGYAFGAMLVLPPATRRRELIGLGGAMIAGFVFLRATNSYGDPDPWSVHSTVLMTMLSFVNCSKYPPSLLFVLMTLGPAVLLLAFLGRPVRLPGRLLMTFGRVPLFFYLAHLPLIHAAALAVTYAEHGEAPEWLFWFPPDHAGEGHGYSLPVVFLVWLLTLAALYPACRWFAEAKRRRPGSWLRYF